ncbi:MAG: hypothetical protein K0V04_24850 [Deltaproteobacteria bacterium]|nr:hypothetical protein [Deltaproteobacteria bacterium]
MFNARFLAHSLCVSTLGLSLAACGGDPKPAATSPTAESAPAAAAETPEASPKAKAADAPTDKVKVVEGKAPGNDDRYALSVVPPSDAAAGQESEVVVRVVPKKPWHMNLDFPTSLKVAPPEGVALANAHLKKGDASTLDDNACEFSVKFTPAQAGEQAFTGQFKFAVCKDEACSPVTEDVAFKVAVK